MVVYNIFVLRTGINGNGNLLAAPALSLFSGVGCPSLSAGDP